MADPISEEQIKRYNDLESKRLAIWDPAWQQISNYFLPELSDINVEKTEGTTGWADLIYDSTPIQAAMACRSLQRNWLTPSSEPWAAFNPPETLKTTDGDEAATWCGKATDIVMAELARSNFYAEVNLDYLSVTVFGTGLLYAAEGKNSPLHFKQHKIGTYCIDEDDEGLVDTVYRKFKMTTRQVKQKFGEDALTPEMQKALKINQLDRKWDILHSVLPREDSKRLKGANNRENKAIADIYTALEERIDLRVGGYDEFPFMCSRFDKWGSDAPWGYSPAFLSLPDARQLNFVTQYMDALAELHAFPRVLIPDSLDGDVDLRAGGVTEVGADDLQRGAKPQEWMSAGDYKLAFEMLQGKKDAVNRAFFVYIAQMLQQLSDKKMTAYEISQRQAENLQQFTSVFDRRVTEFLNPLLKRTFGLLLRQGKFPKPPRSMFVRTGPQTMSLAAPEIVITSRISLALKALQNQGAVSFLTFLAPIMEQRPEVGDNVDWDTLVRDYARNSGVAPDTLTETRKMLQLRAARAQMMQKQRGIELAQGAAKAGKDLEKSPQRLKEAAMDQLQLN